MLTKPSFLSLSAAALMQNHFIGVLSLIFFVELWTMNPMKINLCENLLRRSVDNQYLTFRHNFRENEMLEEKFTIYHRQIRLIDHNIHMAERRFGQQVEKDLGLTVSYKSKPLEPSKNHRFYYPSTKKNWKMKEYVVEPISNVLAHRTLEECALANLCQQYKDNLRRQAQSYLRRKQHFLDQTETLRREDSDEFFEHGPISDNVRTFLPPIQQPHFSKRLTQRSFATGI